MISGLRGESTPYESLLQGANDIIWVCRQVRQEWHLQRTTVSESVYMSLSDRRGSLAASAAVTLLL